MIESDLELKGKGTGGDPYRRVKQYYSLKGELLAEVDPIKEELLSKENITLLEKLEIAEAAIKRLKGEIEELLKQSYILIKKPRPPKGKILKESEDNK